MTYFCIDPYSTIPMGAIVLVEIGIQVRIKYNKKMYFTNEFILEIHFKKLGGK